MIMVPADLLWLLRTLAILGLICGLDPIIFDWLDRRIDE